MVKFHSIPTWFFDRIILEYPKLIIIIFLVVTSFLGYKAKDFTLDASAETLVLEDDKDLRYSRLIHSRYGENDFLFVTYTPKDDLFSNNSLAKLKQLRNELRELNSVSSVVSILDVPLLESPPVPIKKLTSSVQTLESATVDKKLAKIELSQSPIYQNLLISPDLKTTALQINFPIDKTWRDLLTRRNQLREKQADESLSDAELAEFEQVTRQFQTHRNIMRESRHKDITKIRAIMDNYRQDAKLFLGGVSMVADDMVSFIKNDLKVFGIGVFIFLIITLSFIFRKLRWVILPMLCCGFSAISMMGLLGLFGLEVTVISSNFISLQLIITMAVTIHLIVRYRELSQKNPQASQRELVLDTVRLMLRPCLYAGLTTIAGFGSLLLCNILPVITFGWMMIAGITVSLIVTFLLFPAGVSLLNKETSKSKFKVNFSLTSILAKFTKEHGALIMVISLIAFIISVIGISKLVVENRFIDYFKRTTEIYQGMKVIDRHLGGTTPLDVIVEIEKPEQSKDTPKENTENPNESDEFDEFDEFDKAQDDDKYWFTSEKMDQIKKIHAYLDGLPETGKVLSLGTMMKIAEKLNSNKPLDNFKLALLYSELPEEFKNIVLKPYVSVENDQVRFSIRIIDSEKSLKRNELLKRIHSDLIGKLGLKEKNVHLTGMLVLYNNMLQSLFNSQILTLGITVLALMGMFLILFRSIKIALIAIFPNLLSIGVVLGFMGWMKIPLDMMTITIAAISVGIAVDDTIHYIHRFKLEFNIDQNYIKAVHRSHESIGYAMYYTSLTIIIGFSILVLSNFIPSIYFGLLTGLAMLIALLAALTLLPQLIILIKPFGPEPVKE
ncbi:MAG: RND family transporter [Desulfobacterales bacterium]|nr:MMPL family transporter [Deltaproteobacteria bacterium]NNL43460.1 RND family transporter [Desulfobacterales bacterium]